MALLGRKKKRSKNGGVAEGGSSNESLNRSRPRIASEKSASDRSQNHGISACNHGNSVEGNQQGSGRLSPNYLTANNGDQIGRGSFDLSAGSDTNMLTARTDVDPLVRIV